jgi:hypothetical protein
MSALMKEQMNLLPETNESQWQAVLAKDARFDGQFVFAVSSTGIYCRPSCPSRRPRRDRAGGLSRVPPLPSTRGARDGSAHANGAAGLSHHRGESG